MSVIYVAELMWGFPLPRGYLERLPSREDAPPHLGEWLREAYPDLTVTFAGKPNGGSAWPVVGVSLGRCEDFTRGDGFAPLPATIPSADQVWWVKACAEFFGCEDEVGWHLLGAGE